MLDARTQSLFRLGLLAMLLALLALAPASCGGGNSSEAAEPDASDVEAAPAQPVETQDDASEPDAEAEQAPEGEAQSEAEPPDTAASEPEAVVERFMTALEEARFEDALALCDPNATGTFELRDQIDGMNRARESVGEVMYTTTVSYITSSVAEVIWRVMSVEENRAIVAYTGPRDDHEEAQFEVRLIGERWLVAPPPDGMPIPKVRRR